MNNDSNRRKEDMKEATERKKKLTLQSTTKTLNLVWFPGSKLHIGGTRTASRLPRSCFLKYRRLESCNVIVRTHENSGVPFLCGCPSNQLRQG